MEPKRRLAAVVALVVGIATIALAVAVAVTEFPRGLILLGCVLVAGAAAWYGALRRGIARVAGLAVAALALAGALVLLFGGGSPLAELLVVAGLLVSLAAARATMAVHVSLTPAPAPSRPVLFFNPRSGGGKAARFHVADEARDPRHHPDRAHPRHDLETLVREAVTDGADGLAMAGGDGSQAVVAAIAAEHRAPLRLHPRRHPQPLRARPRRRPRRRRRRPRRLRRRRRTDRRPRRSQRPRLRQQRLPRLSTPKPSNAPATAKPSSAPCSTPSPTCSAPTAASTPCAGPGPAGTPTPPAPRCWCPTTATGSAASSVRARVPGSTTGCSGSRSSERRRVVARTGGAPQRPWREWSAPAFEVDADRPVPAGIDGEALVLDPPLRFEIRPGVLRVRISPRHPGASPSAQAPEGVRAGLVELARIAFSGRGTDSSAASPPVIVFHCPFWQDGHGGRLSVEIRPAARSRNSCTCRCRLKRRCRTGLALPFGPPMS